MMPSILPPRPEDWVAAAIHDLVKQDDGTFSGTLTMATIDYHIRGYRKEDGEIRFEFQPIRTKEGEQWMLDYLDGKMKFARAG